MRHILRIIALAILIFPGTAADAEEKVKIAVIFGGSIISSTGLNDELIGARLAVEDINRKGGLLGRQVEIIELGNNDTNLGYILAAQKAVKAGVIAVIGPPNSSQALLAGNVLQEAGIPMIAYIATNPEVTLLGNYMFRICFTDTFQGNALSKFAIQDLRAKTAVVLTCINEKYSLGLSKIFIENFKKKGGSILWEGEYLNKDTDFLDLLKKVKELGPDLIFLPGYNITSGFIVKQARNIGISARFLGGDAWTDDQYIYGGEAIEGNYFSEYWDVNSQDNATKEFVQRFRKDYADKNIVSFGLQYDAVLLLADAVARANSLDPSIIREALAATKDFHGITGDIAMDKDRNPKKPLLIFKFEKNASVFVKTIDP